MVTTMAWGHGGAVRGDLLSCYTASIASYLAHHGIDHELVLGTQLFLAIHFDREQPDRLAFVHYHTPLLGEHRTHTLQLVRRRAIEAPEATRRIVQELRRSTAVLVAGDTMNLPWLASCGRKHAPHWFVVTDLEEEHGTCRIVDRFAFVDEYGIQEPFVGVVDIAKLGPLAQAPSVASPVIAARNAWAFGAREPSTIPVGHGYQWFEAVRPPRPNVIDRAHRYHLLEATWLRHTGRQSLPTLSGPGWICGLAALEMLAEHCAEHLEDPALYLIADDVWVAGRNRQLFAAVLRRIGRESQEPQLIDLAAWCEEYLVQQWAALPRIMRYNAGLLQRGRKPPALLVDTMRAAAGLELQLMERLAPVLEAHISTPSVGQAPAPR